MRYPRMTVHTTVRYEAAHWLPGVPEGHQCGRMHGHSYVLTISVTGQVDPVTGFVIDFADIKKATTPLLDVLDHHVINDIIPNPTVENQLLWWADTLDIPNITRLHLQETANNSATLDL